jgi:hypothetical protein
MCAHARGVERFPVFSTNLGTLASMQAFSKQSSTTATTPWAISCIRDHQIFRDLNLPFDVDRIRVAPEFAVSGDKDERFFANAVRSPLPQTCQKPSKVPPQQQGLLANILKKRVSSLTEMLFCCRL